MLKYDWLKIAEMHVFAKSLAVADFVMADMPVSWTFLNQNCCWRWKLMYMGNQSIVIEFHRRLFAGRKSTAAAVRSGRLNGYWTRGWPVVFQYPGSISNISSTRIQVLKRRFLAMKHQNKLRSEADFSLSTCFKISRSDNWDNATSLMTTDRMLT